MSSDLLFYFKHICITSTSFNPSFNFSGLLFLGDQTISWAVKGSK
jgi:hypothetical protein